MSLIGTCAERAQNRIILKSLADSKIAPLVASNNVQTSSAETTTHKTGSAFKYLPVQALPFPDRAYLHLA